MHNRFTRLFMGMLDTRVQRILLVGAILLLGGSAGALYGRHRGDSPECSTAQLANTEPPMQVSTDPALLAFTDNFFPKFMKENHIPGAVCVVVQDGKTILAKGYGFADLTGQVPMNPDRTVFSFASLSKLVTATAVMQLVERGHVRLEEPIDRYIAELSLPNEYPGQVTMAHLLTHTSGLDDTVIGMARRPEDYRPDLAEYLQEQGLNWAMPPGQFSCYSNTGFALAGYIIERTSGTSFAQYVQENLFKPLRMNRTSFAAIPSPDAATGSYFDGENIVPTPVLRFGAAPAGGLVGTADDMAHFMTAQLENGQFEGQSILTPENMNVLHKRHFSHRPDWEGRCLGWHERFQGDLRTLEHGAIWAGFAAKMVLVPEHRLGILVAYNSMVWDPLDTAPSRILQYCAGDAAAERPSKKVATSDLSRFAGWYRPVAYPRHSIQKVRSLGEQIHVTVRPDGTLSAAPEAKIGWILRPIGEGLFMSDDGRMEIAFREPSHGAPACLLLAQDAYERVNWYEAAGFHRRLFKFFGVAFLAGAGLQLISWAWRRYRGAAQHSDRWRRAYSGASLGLCVLNVLFLGGYVILLRGISPVECLVGLPLRLDALLTLPVFSAVLTIVLGVGLVRELATRKRLAMDGLQGGVVAVLSVAFLIFLHYWNLLAVWG